ncbi:MAG: Gfo/Idh/MocA family oxidoreductase [Lachnospiraceae bacterium]|jgi:predicted dehydrogenase|nr:Gfo/Idh/MocA family oxidoreductase [Lachnospiraceae bacterium]
MKSLKVCFVGIGSIAKRHIANLRQVCSQRGIAVSIDAYRHFVSAGKVAGVEKVFYSIDDVPENYDIIFITNPTELHLQTLQQFHKKGKHFFIEKPAVSVHQLELAKSFEKRRNSVYYVACPLRYNAVIQYIKKEIPVNAVLSVRSISSSYLPDWRPGQDYRNTYSARRKLGGGVSIDLIHEWDYLTYLFGWPKKIACMMGKISRLEIDSDDYAIYIAMYDGMVAELHLDYFGRKSIRAIELFTETDTIVGDLINHKICSLREKKDILFEEKRDDYQRRELEHFLDLVFGAEEPEDHYRHSIRVLGLTQGECEI